MAGSVPLKSVTSHIPLEHIGGGRNGCAVCAKLLLVVSSKLCWDLGFAC